MDNTGVLTTTPQAPQQQQKRSIDVLPKAVNSVCYRHTPALIIQTEECTLTSPTGPKRWATSLQPGPKALHDAAADGPGKMRESIRPARELCEIGVQLHGRPDRIRPARQNSTDELEPAMAPDIAEQRPGMMFRERLLPFAKDRRAKPSRQATGPVTVRNIFQARAQ